MGKKKSFPLLWKKEFYKINENDAKYKIKKVYIHFHDDT